METAAGILERIAREQHSDPKSDDLTVPLALALADAGRKVASLRNAL